MDSSRSQSVIPVTVVRTGFSPWQITRIRDRLANFKAAVRQGWERIALDILDDRGQDEAYVDAEEVRPFSESLRRLVAGSQTPTDERLTAICIFLGNKGYLTPGDLDEQLEALRAPIAFFDFVTGDDEAAKERLARLKVYEGTYSHIAEPDFQSEDQYLHRRLSLKFSGGVIAASLTDSRLNRIDTLRRLKNDAAVRKRALISEWDHHGFAAGMPNGRLIVMVKPKAYDEYYRSSVYLLWAEPKRDDDTTSVPAILLMDYSGVSTVEDVAKAKETLTNGNQGFEFLLSQPSYIVFDRD